LPLALHVRGRLLRDAHGVGVDGDELLEDLRRSMDQGLEQRPPLNPASGDATPTVHQLLSKSTATLTDIDRDRFNKLGGIGAEPMTFGLPVLKGLWSTTPEEAQRTIRTLVNKGLVDVVRVHQEVADLEGPLPPPVRAAHKESRFSMHALLVAHAKRL